MLTIYNKLHILSKTVDDMEGLHCNCPSFILRDPIQPLQRPLNLIISYKTSSNFLCVAFNPSIVLERMDSRCGPCFICLPTRASVKNISTIMFTTISVMAAVGGILI